MRTCILIRLYQDALLKHYIYTDKNIENYPQSLTKTLQHDSIALATLQQIHKNNLYNENVTKSISTAYHCGTSCLGSYTKGRIGK